MLKGQVAEAVNSFHLNPPCHDKSRQMRSLVAAGGEGNRLVGERNGCYEPRPVLPGGGAGGVTDLPEQWFPHL